jgi:hypothetical protein
MVQRCGRRRAVKPQLNAGCSDTRTAFAVYHALHAYYRTMNPFPEDVLVTREIVQAGELLNCQVLDYLLIDRGRS